MNDKGTNVEWIYGFNPVVEAIRSGRKIKTVYISKQRHKDIHKVIEIAEANNISVEFVEKDLFDSRFPKGHQGIAAIIKKRSLLGIDELIEIPLRKGEIPFFLILDLIEDPRNLGAILRIADATGVHGVVFQSYRSAGITGIVSKASAGAIEHVNLSEVVNIKHAINKMKDMNITIIGAEAGSTLTPWDVKMIAPLAIVIGSEGKGIRKTIRDMCDHIVSLPMYGKINSLNVSVATGIICYEVVRQRLSLSV